jgi:hypothetical protein
VDDTTGEPVDEPQEPTPDEPQEPAPDEPWPDPWPQEPPQETPPTLVMRYYRLADGRLRTVALFGDVDVHTPEGAERLTEEEFQAATAAVQEEQAAREAAQLAQEQAQARETYLELVKLLPAEVAARVARYTPTDEDTSVQ